MHSNKGLPSFNHNLSNLTAEAFKFTACQSAEHNIPHLPPLTVSPTETFVLLCMCAYRFVLVCYFRSCIYVCIHGLQVLWQALFNFKEVREKQRGQVHSFPETGKDRSENTYVVGQVESAIKKGLFYYTLYLHAQLLLLCLFFFFS